MLAIKFVKHGPAFPNQPAYTEALCVRTAASVHVRYEKGLRAVVQCGDAPGETFEVTVGSDDCTYDVAYVMNEHGRAVDIIR